MGSEVTRRQFLATGARAGIGTTALAATSSAFLAACSRENASTTAGDNDGKKGADDTLKIGVVAPFSGLGAFIGNITKRSLDAAVQQINSTGGIGGRKVSLVQRDTGDDPTKGPTSYSELAADKDIAGILWCGGLGFAAAFPQIKRDRALVMAVFNDPFSGGQLYPDSDEPGRSVFQMLLPDIWAKEALARYAVEDRGYKTAAHLYNATLDPDGDTFKAFKATFEGAGMQVVGSESYQLFATDYGAELGRLKDKRPHVIYIDGFSGNTAGLVGGLAALSAGYVDRPSVLSPSSWHPHVFGAPGGTGDKTWAELAGDAAKVGTVTAWHVGGLVYLPTFAIREWMAKAKVGAPTGGEESPADALAAVLEGVKKAGSTDRDKLPEAIETMGDIKFASIEFGFSKDRHVSKTKDDVIIVTMERGATGPVQTDPPYELGREWDDGEAFADTAAGPTHLVRPTRAANERAHPEVMAKVVADGYGTHCTKRGDTLTTDCKIH